MLIGVADHGAGAPSCAAARLAASGNRQSISAAIAAGILDHRRRARRRRLDLHGIDRREASRMREGRRPHRRRPRRCAAVDEAVAAKRRLPGLGHRVHTTDPRVAVLFDMARAEGVAGDGIRFMEALEAQRGQTHQAAADEHRRRAGGDPARYGFRRRSPARFLFIIGRVAGLTAEVAEEYAREKPMRIKFDVEYDGVPPKHE